MIKSKTSSLSFARSPARVHNPKHPTHLSVTGDQQYHENKRTLSRMLSMKSMVLASPSKYEQKYRELKCTYNQLLGVSRQLEREYQGIIMQLKETHRKDFEALKDRSSGERERLKDSLKGSLREMERSLNEKEGGVAKAAEQIERTARAMLEVEREKQELVREKEQLFGMIDDLRRENFALSHQKEEMMTNNSMEMSSIRGILDKLQLTSKQLDLTKSALQSQRSTSLFLRRQLEDYAYRVQSLGQQNGILVREQEIKNRTVKDLQKLVGIGESIEEEKVQKTCKRQGYSPKKGRIVMEIQHMIDNYKRNLKDY